MSVFMIALILGSVLFVLFLIAALVVFFYSYKKNHKTIDQRIKENLLVAYHFQLIKQTEHQQWFECRRGSLQQLWLLIDGVQFEQNEPNYNHGVKVWLIAKYITTEPATLAKIVSSYISPGYDFSPYQWRFKSVSDLPEILTNKSITIGPLQAMRQYLNMPVIFHDEGDAQLLAIDCDPYVFGGVVWNFPRFLNRLASLQTNDAARRRVYWRRRLLISVV